MSDDIDDVRSYFIEGLDDDWISFAEVPAMIRETTGSADNLVHRAGQVAASLVAQGAIVAGDLTDDGFHAWPTSPAESANRIERDVATLVDHGTYPKPGDLCWFDLPAPASPEGRAQPA